MGLERIIERKIPRSPVGIVTGSSMGTGRRTVLELSAEGQRNILGISSNPNRERDQQLLVEIVGRDGNRMLYLLADLADPTTPNLIVRQVTENFDSRVNILDVNAANGYRRHAVDSKEAMDVAVENARKFNVDTQFQLIDNLLPYMIPGGVIVFNQSDPAHNFHRVNVDERIKRFGDYTPVAQSKKEFEELLRGRKYELMQRGVRTAFVVGNALSGTIVAKMLRISQKSFLEEGLSRTEGGVLPNISHMAAAVSKVALNKFQTGHIEYVGVAPQFQLYASRPVGRALSGALPMMDSVLTREEIENFTPYRWPDMLVGGVSEIEFGQRAVASLVNLRHPDIDWREGYLRERPLVPSTLIHQALEQLAVLSVLGLEQFRGRIPVMTSVDSIRFEGDVKPGEPIQLIAEGMNMKEARGMAFGEGHVRAMNFEGKPVVEGNVSFALLDPAALKVT